MNPVQPLDLHLYPAYTTNELCVFTQSSIGELARERFAVGLPYVVALFEGVDGGTALFDGEASFDYIRVSEELRIPQTRETCGKIVWLISNGLMDGYRPLSSFYVHYDNIKKRIEKFFAENLTRATNPTDPFAHHSMEAVICHYEMLKKPDEVKKWKWILFQHIERHYGVGKALLTALIIASDIAKKQRHELLCMVVDKSVDSSRWDRLFENSLVDDYINANREKCFAPSNQEKLAKVYLNFLKAKGDDSSALFAQIYCSVVLDEELESHQLDIMRTDSFDPFTAFLLARLYENGEPSIEMEQIYQTIREACPNYLYNLSLLLEIALKKDQPCNEEKWSQVKGIMDLIKSVNPSYNFASVTMFKLEMERARFEGKTLSSTEVEQLADDILKVHSYKAYPYIQYAGLRLSYVPEDSLEYLRRAYEIEPDNIDIRCALARQLYAQGVKLDDSSFQVEALTSLSRLVSEEPDSYEANLLLGAIHVADSERIQVDPRLGIACLRKARSLKPNDPEPIFYLAKVLIRGRDEADRNEANELISKIPSNFANRDLLELEITMRNHLYKGEFEELKEFHGRRNYFFNALFVLVVILNKLESRYGEAFKVLEDLIDYYPDYMQSYPLLAYMCRHGLGLPAVDLERAEDLMKTFRDSAPSDFETLLVDFLPDPEQGEPAAKRLKT